MKSAEFFRRGATALLLASQLHSTPVLAQEVPVFVAPEAETEQIETVVEQKPEETVIDPLSVAVIQQAYAGRPAASLAPLIVKYSKENNLDPDLITALGMIESGAGAGAPRGYWFGVTRVYLPTRDIEVKYVAELLAGKILPQYKTATGDLQKLRIFNGGNDPKYLEKYNALKQKLADIRKQLEPFFLISEDPPQDAIA